MVILLGRGVVHKYMKLRLLVKMYEQALVWLVRWRATNTVVNSSRRMS